MNRSAKVGNKSKNSLLTYFFLKKCTAAIAGLNNLPTFATSK